MSQKILTDLSLSYRVVWSKGSGISSVLPKNNRGTGSNWRLRILANTPLMLSKCSCFWLTILGTKRRLGKYSEFAKSQRHSRNSKSCSADSRAIWARRVSCIKPRSFTKKTGWARSGGGSRAKTIPSIPRSLRCKKVYFKKLKLKLP